MKDKSGNCVKCGTWRQTLHRDHIIPRWKGGSDDLSNIQRVCANCHEDKTREDMKGKPVSEEQKAAHSLKMKGRKASDETRRKLSEAHRGKNRGPWSQERKDAIKEERNTRWTPEKRLAHSLISSKDWESLSDDERELRLASIRNRTSKDRIANATKASLAAKALRDSMTPEEKAIKRIERAEKEVIRLTRLLEIEKAQQPVG